MLFDDGFPINENDPFNDAFIDDPRILLQGKILNDSKENEAPDTYGSDGIFVRSFGYGCLEYEICHIARTYIENKGIDVFKDDEYIPYSDVTIQTSSPVDLYRVRIISYLLYHSRKGDEFSTSMLKYLYKALYRKEYKILKRFSKISRFELWSIVSKEEFDYVSLMDHYEDISRILTICDVMGITPDVSCNLFYNMLNFLNSTIEGRNQVKSICDWTEEDVKASEATVTELFGTDDFIKMNEISTTYNDMLSFMFKAMEYYGYSSDLIDIANEEFAGVDRDYSITLLLLKKVFPKRTFSKEELEYYASLLFAVASFCCSHNNFEEVMNSLMCTPPEFDEYVEFFDEEDFLKTLPAKSTKPQVQSQKPEPKNEAAVQNKETNYKEEDLLRQISELQASLRNKDNQLKSMSIQYAETKRKLSEAEIQNSKFTSDHDELIALRNHVYETTMNDTSSPIEISADEMIKELNNKKILIVGGHTNWIARMKELFPDWKYINFKSTTTINDSVLNESIDYVYFFTDMLKHHVYYRFVGLVKTKGLTFGYLNGSNIDATVKQMYKDLIK